MREALTRNDGTELTYDEAVFCWGDRGARVYHDWVYHRADRAYKCKRCGVSYAKAELKYLTD